MNDLFTPPAPSARELEAAAVSGRPVYPVQPIEPFAGHPIVCTCGGWATHGFNDIWRCRKCAVAEGRMAG